MTSLLIVACAYIEARLWWTLVLRKPWHLM